ncbi:ribose/xylose/arabinose/galactoside ABC-type transport system permease subunit [Halarchaeum solikamskense]|uniref:ABC transporter permease n=1 Tax=Halarchaeum nitratireducens TaxID=489913 RepID=UPI001B3AD6FD|nr:ABC transporter permease [Halarchaeum solikamskense]MBP2252374.1 ribose/xylose/arabinose/galactoside ABC-type transport system permease subunit [Halarchaeum solikamskense]
MSEAQSDSMLADLFEDRTVQDWARDAGPIAMLIILVVLFSVLSSSFFTFSNLVNSVMMNSTILLLVALAATFPILQQSIDLSVAANLGFSGVLTAMAINQFGPVGILVGPIAGLSVGLVNGVVFAKGKIPSFLVTLGTQSVFMGAALLITNGSSQPYRSPFVQEFAIGHVIPHVPNLVIWGLVFYAITVFIAFYTPFGRYTYALGESETVTELSGVPVDRYKIGVFALSGLLCGVAGALLTARISSGAAGMGSGLLLQSIAGVVMGGTALTGGVGGPHRTIIGVLVIGVLANGMNLIGVGSFTQEIILGVVVILAVAMSMDREKIDIVK